MFKPSGNIFYSDCYDTQYRVTWETVDGLIDITTIIAQPRTWGKQEEGYVRNKIVYRKGIISVIRQIIKLVNNGYEIVAEGTSQYIDFIQCNFPCVDGPKDTFLHHFDNTISDETDIRVTSGTHWTDPSDTDDNVFFADDIEPLNYQVARPWWLVARLRETVEIKETLKWIDVWA